MLILLWLKNMLTYIENSQADEMLQYEALGFHIVIDMYDIEIDDKGLIDLVEASIKVGKLTKISSHYHFYENRFSGIILLAESHLSLHVCLTTKYAYLDVYTCGDPQGAIDCANFLQKSLNPKKVIQKALHRGLIKPKYI